MNERELIKSFYIWFLSAFTHLNGNFVLLCTWKLYFVCDDFPSSANVRRRPFGWQFLGIFVLTWHNRKGNFSVKSLIFFRMGSGFMSFYRNLTKFHGALLLFGNKNILSTVYRLHVWHALSHCKVTTERSINHKIHFATNWIQSGDCNQP